MKQSIRHLGHKIKLISGFLNKREIFIMLLIILTSTASFGLGRMSLIEINKNSLYVAQTKQNLEKESVEGRYVASRNGSKYHLPWCSGAQRISEGNKIWFDSKEDAESRGYTPAANCKGI